MNTYRIIPLYIVSYRIWLYEYNRFLFKILVTIMWMTLWNNLYKWVNFIITYHTQYWFPFQLLDARGHKSNQDVIKNITNLLRLMLVASEQAPSTFGISAGRALFAASSLRVCKVSSCTLTPARVGTFHSNQWLFFQIKRTIKCNFNQWGLHPNWL